MLKIYQQSSRNYKERAMGIFKSLLEKNPNDPESLFYIGLINADKGSFKAARKYFKKAKQAGLLNVELLNKISEQEKILPKKRSRLKIFLLLTALAGAGLVGYPYYLLEKAVDCEKRGDKRCAQINRKKAVKINPLIRDIRSKARGLSREVKKLLN